MASRLNVTELDFDSIKNNLKDFLTQQSEFQDYDFEGSGLSVLLDILAYNTHYNAYYMNMVANESFMESAILRNSVVSHAKTYGYTPRSVAAPLAVLDFTVMTDNNTPGTLTIPRGYKFMSNLIDGKSYGFVTLENKTVTKTANNFVFNDLPIYEGRLVSYSYAYDSSSNPNRTFTIPDSNVDTTSLTITVQESSSNTDSTVFTTVQEYFEASANSEVYFTQESIDGKYQIYFGDGIIGKTIDDGNIVVVSYLITNGPAANGADAFKATAALSGHTNFDIDVIVNGSGGAERESVDSIKFNAPLQLLSQNRAVTKNDYVKLINQRYPHFDSVNVWGGEENDPPVYGRVFISAKPKLGFEITDTEKEYIKNKILKPISVMTVVPEFVDPDYTYLKLDIELFVDVTKSSVTLTDIEEQVRQYTLTWADTNLNKFDSYFNYSGLETGVNLLSKSILSNEVETMLGKKFRPDLLQAQSYVLDYGIELARGTTDDNFYTTPDFTMIDEDGIARQCYFEEVPSSYTGVEAITVTNPGFNYTSTPTLEIVGDGTGAVAVANIVNGKLESVTVTNPGVGYTSAIVRIVGGGGQSAEVMPVLEGRYGQLRIVYYKTDSLTNQNTKFVLNSGVNSGVIGSIDYILGKVHITLFNPTNVNNDFKDIMIFFRPKSNIMRTTGNKIFVLDSNDGSSVTVESKLK